MWRKFFLEKRIAKRFEKRIAKRFEKRIAKRTGWGAGNPFCSSF